MNVINLWTVGEAVEREVPQVVRIAYRNVDQEVVTTRNMEYASHLRQLDDIILKRVHQIARVLSKTDRDQRLESDANCGRVDFGMVATEHTQSGQSPHPFEAGRGSDADRLRESVVRHASILL